MIREYSRLNVVMKFDQLDPVMLLPQTSPFFCGWWGQKCLIKQKCLIMQHVLIKMKKKIIKDQKEHLHAKVVQLEITRLVVLLTVLLFLLNQNSE